MDHINPTAFKDNDNRLFHVSEVPDISVFEPRPSPSYFAGINGDVVFAISGRLLHNYLLPRDCPRVTYYVATQTTTADKERFMGETEAGHVIVVESVWYRRIMETRLYCYEFSPSNFTLIDDCAGYFVSHESVVPISVYPVNDIIEELLGRNVELRFTPSLLSLADAVSKSTLNFSLIRMRNARV
jgi:hypothetical protein